MKKGICTRGTEYHSLDNSIISGYTPKAGDLALFEVIELGKHTSIQGVSGNNSYLFPGDEFLAVFGNRYATEQFEGYVPSKPTIDLEILGKGGVVGVMKSMHYKFEDIGTTKIRLKAFAVDEEKKVVNSIYFNKERKNFNPNSEVFNNKIILSLGGSMDSGKTTTAAFLARAISKRNKKVAFIKLTGTYYTKDSHFVRDCGAATAIDFGLAGYPSTFLTSEKDLLNLYQYLIEEVATQNPDYIVMEIADGILQQETEMLIKNKAFKSTIDSVIFSAVDSLSALYGLEKLGQLGLPPFALSGLFTASPLLQKEVEARTRTTVLNLEQLEKFDINSIDNQLLQAI